MLDRASNCSCHLSIHMMPISACFHGEFHPRSCSMLSPFHEICSILSLGSCRDPVVQKVILMNHWTDREGFLDIYNGTTKQWVPICDDRFTERNTQVVCRQLGYNTVHTFHDRNKRTEMFPNALIRIQSWPDPIQCDGECSAHCFAAAMVGVVDVPGLHRLSRPMICSGVWSPLTLSSHWFYI